MRTYTVFVDYENERFDESITDEMLRNGGFAFDEVIFKEYSDAKEYASSLPLVRYGKRIVTTETDYKPGYYEVTVKYLDTRDNAVIEEDHLLPAYHAEAAKMFVRRDVVGLYIRKITFPRVVARKRSDIMPNE